MSRTAESESSRCIASNPFYNLSSVTGVKGWMTLASVILCVFVISIDPVNQCKISSPENFIRFGWFVKNRDC
jgi:hypothetical protein